MKTNYVAAVNRALRAAGYEEKLTAGRGYYYWRDGNGIFWPSVYVYRATEMTIEEWLREAARNMARRG